MKEGQWSNAAMTGIFVGATFLLPATLMLQWNVEYAHLGASVARASGGVSEPSWPNGTIEVCAPGSRMIVSVTPNGKVTYYPPDGGAPYVIR